VRRDSTLKKETEGSSPMMENARIQGVTCKETVMFMETAVKSQISQIKNE
jgi:hypothetical protein